MADSAEASQQSEKSKASVRRLLAALRNSRQIRDQVLSLPAVAKSLRAIVVLASGLRSEPITLRAAALTYLTVLSLVPLLAVVFSLFQAVVGTAELQSKLQDFILANLAVGARESFSKNITQYIARASSGAIGGVGFVFLVGSAVSLMANVEAAFNHTFRAPRQRSLPLRFGVYWCLLTLGPILLALSVAATALLQSARLFSWLGPLRQAALLVTPFLITYAAFTLLYLIVPAVQVKRRAAIIGALVAGTAWEIAKILYAWASANSVRQNAIYGSLSAIPIFLMWTYISWILVLFGARVAYVVQAAHHSLGAEVLSSPLRRELMVAQVMRGIAQAFVSGLQAPGVRALADGLGSPESLVRAALGDLETASLVRELASGGWVPAKALETIRLRDVRFAARGGLEGADWFEPALAELVGRWAAADEAADGVLDITMAELVKPAEAITVPP